MRIASLLGIGFCVTIAGCSEQQRSSETAAELSVTTSPSTEQAEVSEAPAEIPLDIASWEQLLEKIATNQGKVTVLDIWSTSCIPCLQKFHHLVEIQEAYPDKVVCMSLNIDYIGAPDQPPESYRERAAEFLTKQNAAFPNFICSDTDEEIYAKLDLAAIPVVMVFDQSGSLSKRFDNDYGEYGDGGFTYQDHVVSLVKQLLGES